MIRAVFRPLRAMIRIPWFLLLVSVTAFTADATAVAVLYPDVREPYKSVFMEILSGIEGGTTRPIKPYALPQTFVPDEVRGWLRAERVGAVIALGTTGLKAARDLDGKFLVIGGAALLSPADDDKVAAGISLAADPDVMFSFLASLVPRARRVFVVYDPEQNGWLIDLARRGAARRGLTLVAFEAKDIREAAIRYRAILKEMRSGTDALWLPIDTTTVDDRITLPVALEAAWDRDLVVFSSNPAHAQRGALFSVYPDQYELGRHLANLLRETEQNGVASPTGVAPLTDLRLAVNLRTASHLGLRFTPKQRESFGLVFPGP